jgi:anti-anti-sigma factor
MVLEVREIAPGLVQVVGRVDLTTVAGLRERLGEAVDRAIADQMPILSVDLQAVQMVDATGLGVLLGAHRRARRGGSRLRLVRLSPELSQLLLVSRLYRVLDIEHTAMAGMGTKGERAARSAVPEPRQESSDSRPVASGFRPYASS